MEENRLLLLYALLTEAMIETNGADHDVPFVAFAHARNHVVLQVGREPTVVEVEAANDAVSLAVSAAEYVADEDADVSLTLHDMHGKQIGTSMKLALEGAQAGSCHVKCPHCERTFCAYGEGCPFCTAFDLGAKLGWGQGPQEPTQDA